MLEFGEITRSYTKSGLARYEVEIRHDGLNKYQVIKSDDPYVVEQKALAKLAQWDEMWRKKEEARCRTLERERQVAANEDAKQHAANRTFEAQEQLAALDRILSDTLVVNDAVDWDSLKNKSDYPQKRPQPPPPPKKPDPPVYPVEPKVTDAAYQPPLNFLDMIVRSRKETKLSEASVRFRHDHERWKVARNRGFEKTNEEIRAYNAKVKDMHEQYTQIIEKWERDRAAYIAKRDQANLLVDRRKEKYLSGAPEAISDYCDMVLNNSSYPDFFP